MKTRVNQIWRRLRCMPAILKNLTIFLWVGGAFLLVASFTPGWERIEGGDLSLAELWSDGTGISIVLAGLGMLLLGTGIYKGWSWVRHILMLGIVLVATSGFVDPDYRDLHVFILAGITLVIVVVAVRYLYFRERVVTYFTGLRQQNKASHHNPLPAVSRTFPRNYNPQPESKPRSR